MLKKWDEIPDFMKNDKVKMYYEILEKRKLSLIFKRIFEFVLAIIFVIIFTPLFLIISVVIKLDSKGPVIFRQERVTQYGKRFRIYKFRTMIKNADKIGVQVTTNNDVRITRVGRVLRKLRLDEIPQLFNIIKGEMSFVGTRPEVPKYVENYTDEMLATLLLPAGVTSDASINFKDEELLLATAADADNIYINKILPKKMRYNLKSLENFNLFMELNTMLKTIIAVIK